MQELTSNELFKDVGDSELYGLTKELRDDLEMLKQVKKNLLQDLKVMEFKNKWGKYDGQIMKAKIHLGELQVALQCQWLIIETYQAEINYRKYGKK